MEPRSAQREREVERREVTDFPVKVPCRGCGREITLWFNAGELDRLGGQ
jgi:hypothetical protein